MSVDITEKPLRYYQKEAIQGVLNWWNNIGNRALVSMWPGSGKTLTGVKLIRQIHETIKPRPRVIWLAHRQELITQPNAVFYNEFIHEVAAREFKLGMIGGVDGVTHRDYKANVYCASIQSLIRNGEASKHLEAILAQGPIDYLVVDETHHIVANTYVKLLDILYAKNKNTKLLGITGTHDRADNISLKNVFSDESPDGVQFAYRYDFEQARADRVSAPIHPFEMKTQINLSQFKTGDNGEVSQARYDELWEAGNWGHLMVEGLKQKGFPDEICLAFMPSVKISASFIKFLGEEYNIEGAHIGESGALRWSNHHSDMVPIKRSEMWRLYNKGDLRIVANFNVATEGFDSPRTKLGLLCRRTKSPGTYIQMAARYTRPYPGPTVTNEFATLLHVGFRGHEFIDSSYLGGDMLSEEIKEIEGILDSITITTTAAQPKRMCPQCGKEVTKVNGKIVCETCQLEWVPPNNNNDLFFDIHDPNKIDGQGVHFEALKLIRDAEVSWTQERGLFSVFIGTAGNGNILQEFGDLIGDSNKRFFAGKSQRVLLIAMPGVCPKVDPKEYALIGVYKPVTSSEWVGSGWKKYQVHNYASQDYVLIATFKTLDEAIARANKIIARYKDPVLADSNKSWRNDPISPKQAQALKRWEHLFDVKNLTKGKASDIQTFMYAQDFLIRNKVLVKP